MDAGHGVVEALLTVARGLGTGTGSEAAKLALNSFLKRLRGTREAQEAATAAALDAVGRNEASADDVARVRELLDAVLEHDTALMALATKVRREANIITTTTNQSGVHGSTVKVGGNF